MKEPEAFFIVGRTLLWGAYFMLPFLFWELMKKFMKDKDIIGTALMIFLNFIYLGHIICFYLKGIGATK